MKFPKIDFARVLPPVLLALSIANFVLACHVGRQNYPTVIREVQVVTNVIDSVSLGSLPSDISNRLASVAGLIPSLPSSEICTNMPSQVCETSYQYFVSGRRIGCKMFGRFYYEGSPCSYGRISYIYPDRILLASGDWISNQQRFDNGSLVVENERSSR